MSGGLEPYLVRFDREDGQPVGVGCLLQSNIVVTCAHVIADALGDRNLAFQSSAPTQQVKLSFPYADVSNEQRCDVVGWFPAAPFASIPPSGICDLGFVTLKESAPEGVEFAQLSERLDLAPHEFLVFGYPQDMPIGDFAEGRTMGRIPCNWYRMTTTQTLGRKIKPGFSGGPVLLPDLSIIGGIVVAHDQDPNIAGGFMISGHVVGAALQTLKSDRVGAKTFEPKKDIGALDAPRLAPVYDAPGFPTGYVERPDLLKRVRGRLLGGDRTVGITGQRGVGLHGMGGSEKPCWRPLWSRTKPCGWRFRMESIGLRRGKKPIPGWCKRVFICARRVLDWKRARSL